AQRILADFGYADAPADTAQGFQQPPDYLRWLASTDDSTARWTPARVGQGPALLFWYRTSPQELEPDSPSPSISPSDPSLTLTGQTPVVLDTKGRLVEFRRLPPQRDAGEGPPASPQWAPMFGAAGLSMAAFTPVAPEWTPKDFADTRAAWE